MKKTYESPKSEIVNLASTSFLEASGGIFGGSIGDLYATDIFGSDFGQKF